MRTAICLAAAAAVCAIAGATASAQDFQKTYNVGPGGRIVVTNMSGDVTVRGYNGSSVVVTAKKTGRDRDRVEIEDSSAGDRVEVGAKYPRHCNCDASVDFVVEVPNGLSLKFEKISSMSGNVAISDVTGDVHASSMSGDVRVGDVSGTVNATAMSGDVTVDIARLEGAGDMSFTAMSGNVEVRLPSDAGAEVSLRTTSGDIKTDFPISIREAKYGSGASADGQIGDASRRLTMRSMSGDVRLLRH